MDIEKFDVRFYHKGVLHSAPENLTHVKSLPYLSVVQATRGHYDFGFTAMQQVPLPEGGAFISPARQMQYITHHPDKNGEMYAHWLFVDILVDGQPLDEVYAFPMLLPPALCMPLQRFLEVFPGRNKAAELSAVYGIVDLLLTCGTRKELPDGIAFRARHLLEEDLTLTLSSEMLAQACHVSVPTLFREFQRVFGISPRQYLLARRLEKGMLLLETTEESVTEIALSCGFCDQPYFTKRFCARYGISPSDFRKTK